MNTEANKDLRKDGPLSQDADHAAQVVSADSRVGADNQNVPSSENITTPVVNFPVINRRIWDVFHDDERNEIWVGVKCRLTVKGQTKPNGPVEDVEINHDAIVVITSLDAAKQEVLMALGRDAQMLNEKRASRERLKASGILGRLTDGLGKVFAGKIH